MDRGPCRLGSAQGIARRPHRGSTRPGSGRWSREAPGRGRDREPQPENKEGFIRRTSSAVLGTVAPLATSGLSAYASAAHGGSSRALKITLYGAQGSTRDYVFMVISSLDGTGAANTHFTSDTPTTFPDVGTSVTAVYFGDGISRQQTSFEQEAASAPGISKVTGTGRYAGGTGIHERKKCNCTYVHLQRHHDPKRPDDLRHRHRLPAPVNRDSIRAAARARRVAVLGAIRAQNSELCTKEVLMGHGYPYRGSGLNGGRLAAAARAVAISMGLVLSLGTVAVAAGGGVVVPPTGKVAGEGYAYYEQRSTKKLLDFSRPVQPCQTLAVNGQRVAYLPITTVAPTTNR